jgi:hypothetical protein
MKSVVGVMAIYRQHHFPADFLIVRGPTISLKILREDPMEHGRKVQGWTCCVILEVPRDKRISGIR